MTNRKYKIIKLFKYSAILMAINTSATAIAGNQDFLIATKCFVESNNFDYKQLAYSKADDLMFISVDQAYWQQQLSVVNSNKLSSDCGKFININIDWQEYIDNKKIDFSSNSDTKYYNDFFVQHLDQQKAEMLNKAIFDTPNFSLGISEAKLESADDLFSKVSSKRISDSLRNFTSLYNRAAYNTFGVQAAERIKHWMEELRDQNNKTPEDFSVELVSTKAAGYIQPSVVAILGKNLPGNALVISAHLDSAGGGRRPGADDDGSGSMVVVEAARVMLESGQNFNRPVYFIWYAAEEAGLIGSREVVKFAKANNWSVDSVLHFDTVGRRAKEDDATLWFLRDNVDNDFTDYVVKLVEKYVKLPVDYTTCGYACSDHASWTDGGFISAAAVESSFANLNPYLHTAEDTMEKVSLDNLVNYTKLALAYVVDRSESGAN